MINICVQVGRLTRDPELRYTGSGNAIATFTLAVDREYTDAQGNRPTDFIPVKCWRKLAETVANHLNKGRLVCVVGSWEVEEWEKDGQRRRRDILKAETVKFLDWPKDQGQGGGDYNDGFMPVDDDDVPF